MPERTIAVTGQHGIYALLHTVDRQTPVTDDRLAKTDAAGERILLVTSHRREN